VKPIKWWIWLLIGLVVGASIPIAALAASPALKAPTARYVALIELSGAISYSESPLALISGGALTPRTVEELIEQVRSDPYASAAVLVINSPGGSAAASEEIYQMIKRLSEERVVVAYIAEYGASGGYYIALPGKEIIASPHALTGSIGAISIVTDWHELMGKLGIRAETFKSGRLKDVGSPWRPMTNEERELMRSLIDSTAQVFRNRVEEHRGDKIKDWEEVLTARPYLGVEAAEVGLVDKVGNLEDAVAEARRLANLPEDAPARWIRPKAPGLLELLLGTERSAQMKLSYEILMMWPLPSPATPSQVIGVGAAG